MKSTNTFFVEFVLLMKSKLLNANEGIITDILY